VKEALRSAAEAPNVRWHGLQYPIDLDPVFQRDAETLCAHLFSAVLLKLDQVDGFLPAGAIVDCAGRMQFLVVDVGEGVITNSARHLPFVHKHLRIFALEHDARTVAVIEDVGFMGGKLDGAHAAKVLLESREGGCLAAYRTYHKDPSGHYAYDGEYGRFAAPEVDAWRQSPVT
jgi:hypothetical protein